MNRLQWHTEEYNDCMVLLLHRLSQIATWKVFNRSACGLYFSTSGWVCVCWHSFQTEGWLADLMQPGAHEQTQWNMYEPSVPQQRTWGRWASHHTWRRTGWCWWSCRLYPDHRRSSAGSGSACFLWRERAAAAWREKVNSTEQLHCETVMHFYNTCISISTCVCVHYQCIVHTPLSSGLQHSPEKL